MSGKKEKAKRKAEKVSMKPVVISTTPTLFPDDKKDNFMVIDLRKIIMQFGGAPYAMVFRRVTNSEHGKDNVMALDFLFEQTAISTKNGIEIAMKTNKWWNPKKEQEKKKN